MTLITFSDGKPVLRDGQVGTEQACCCGCCLKLRPWLRIVGWDPGDWDACGQQIIDELTARFSAAGWTLSVTTVTGEVDGITYVFPAVSVECEHCMASFCDLIADNYQGGTFDITNQDINDWYDLQLYDNWLCQNNYLLSDLIGALAYSGCCGRFDGYNCPVLYTEPGLCTAAKINGVGNESSAWIPVCNPLP